MARYKRAGIVLLILSLLILQGYFMGAKLPWPNMPLMPHASQISIVQQAAIIVKTQRQQNTLSRPNFQAGIIFPQTGTNAYGPQDANWQAGLSDIADQTAARWIALTINFEQVSSSATSVQTTNTTPSPATVAAGIQLARSQGYHIFVQPLLTVEGANSWAGSIQFASEKQAQDWFDSYWHTYQPYIQAATQAGADELALGTEFERLQPQWNTQWEQLIARAHGIFPGKLTYDMNWTSMGYPIPAWMHNASLTAIGVSVYTPLVSTPQQVPLQNIAALWGEKIGRPLDELAQRLHKPVLISEIGYRDSSDALYNPWQAQTKAPADEQEQAAAYNAALQYVVTDTVLEGIFFWAWSLPPYAPNNLPAAQELYKWYSSSLS